MLGDLARERAAALVHSNTSVVLAGGALGSPTSPRSRDLRRRGPRAALAALAQAAARADALACVSARGRRAVRGSPKASCSTTAWRANPTGGAQAARQALGLPARRFVVALIGRISDWKGQDLLAEAIAGLDDIEAIGLVAGDAGPGRRGSSASWPRPRGGWRAGSGSWDSARTWTRSSAPPTPWWSPRAAGPVSKLGTRGRCRGPAGGRGVARWAARDRPRRRDRPAGSPERPRRAHRGAAPPGRGRGSRARLGRAAARDAAARFGRERMLAEVEIAYERLAPTDVRER